MPTAAQFTGAASQPNRTVAFHSTPARGRHAEALTERPLRLALATSYPPSRLPLSEYGWHLVEALKANERVGELYVLADRTFGRRPCREGKLRIVPAWSFNGIDLPASVARFTRQTPVDAIWFNLHLTSTGNRWLSNFAGMTAPAITRLAGVPTLVTLHNMLGCTDLALTAVRVSRLAVLGAHLATKLASSADLVCVLRPEYARVLEDHYGVRHARYMPIGTPGVPLESVCRGSRRGILAFGKFGSNKQLEPLIEATIDLSATMSVHLDIAGTSSRHNPGYLDRLREKYRSLRCVTFRGYIEESDVPNLFRQAAVSVLPYTTTTGMSSVAVQSAMYGTPIVATDIAGFRALEREGLDITFARRLDKQSLQAAITEVLASDEDVRYGHAVRNLEYCQRQRMDAVVDKYVDALYVLLRQRR